MNFLRVNWRALLLATGFLALGAAVGGATVTMIGIRKFRQNLREPAAGPGFADRAADRIGADLTRTLDLTPDQAAHVKERLGASAVKLRALRVQMAREAREEIRSMIRDIGRDLPPEKRLEFRRLVIRRFEKLGMQPPADTP